ncbi:MAG TPA: hypothetical protein VLE53_12570 [Gemmatimonadaceae bacterium]|nr:hypothetical protein [Gemmatimonadaceae bacterium]
MFPPALRALLAGAIDYAGLFPPASLGMTAAVGNYDDYRRGADAWALGRFVVPTSRLDEFVAVMSERPAPDGEGRPWRVSAILGGEADAEVLAIRSANQRLGGTAVVDCVEVRTPSAADVERISAAAAAGTEVFVEVPVDGDIESITFAAARHGAHAKIRTGGVTADAFPTAAQVAHFLRACHERGIAFKATAGLHHPLRASYPLTYESRSRRTVMFGFLNVMLAAMLVWKGEDEATVTALLEERTPDALSVGAAAIRWQEHELPAAEIARARAGFVRGFGSCSFREPLDELRALAPMARS